VETFPLTFTNLTTTTVNTLTVRPQLGAVNLLITSADTTAAKVDLNGAQFVTFDGRPGGAGTAKQLTIANTSTAGVAVRFINEASGNALRFLTLQGANTSATAVGGAGCGIVFFSTINGANGNDNNTLDTCNLRDGATTPANGPLLARLHRHHRAEQQRLQLQCLQLLRPHRRGCNGRSTRCRQYRLDHHQQQLLPDRQPRGSGGHCPRHLPQ